MFNPSRQDARQFFFDTWKKQKTQSPLSDLEEIVLNILRAHPEYHHILDQPGLYYDKDWSIEGTENNPFLHLSLHLAIEEQRAIDQPRGICLLYAELCTKYQNEHTAQHKVMEALAETIWYAQRYGSMLDTERYLSAIRHYISTSR